MVDKRPRTLTEEAAEFSKAINELGRLIKEEFERTALKINDIWKQRRNPR